jgi:hypothetical protein
MVSRLSFGLGHRLSVMMWGPISGTAWILVSRHRKEMSQRRKLHLFFSLGRLQAQQGQDAGQQGKIYHHRRETVNIGINDGLKLHRVKLNINAPPDAPIAVDLDIVHVDPAFVINIVENRRGGAAARPAAEFFKAFIYLFLADA